MEYQPRILCLLSKGKTRILEVSNVSVTPHSAASTEKVHFAYTFTNVGSLIHACSISNSCDSSMRIINWCWFLLLEDHFDVYGIPF